MFTNSVHIFLCLLFMQIKSERDKLNYDMEGLFVTFNSTANFHYLKSNISS